MKEQMQRWISLLLAVVMVIGMVPMQVFATEGTQETEAVEVVTEPAETPEVIHEHDYKAVVTDPTCTEQGYTTYTCECGESYVDEYVDAIGEHTYENGVCLSCGRNDTTVELFGGFSAIDFFLKDGVLSDGQEHVVAIYSNTNNARMAVIHLKDGATYRIRVSNNGGAATKRMKICTFAERFSEMTIAPLASERNMGKLDPSVVSVAQDVIFWDANIGENCVSAYEGTFVNTGNAKTMILFTAWGADPSLVEVSVKSEDHQFDTDTDAGGNNLKELTEILAYNIGLENEATQKIMEIAKGFWEHRDEFIYCSGTALDQPWNYWSYTGYVDSANTGKTVTAENAGFKRIDCSTFVRYVINGIDYYSTPYYNALEHADVEQGGLDAGVEVDSKDPTVCRTGKIDIRPGKKLILEAKNSNYAFTKVFGYDASGKAIQTLENTATNTVFVPDEGVVYLRAEMKVTDESDYASASAGVPAAILKCLRIREDERLEINADCPLSGYRNANQMCKWLDENGYAVAFDKESFNVAGLRVGSVIFWGRTSGTWAYKNITHTSLYIGDGYILHVSAPYGLLGGEGILIEPIEKLMVRYDIPLAAISSPRYHTAAESHTHSYTITVTAPTCTEQGYTTYTCECGDSYVADYVDALGHIYENGICTGCGEADPNEVAEPLDLRYDDHYDVTGKTVEIVDAGKPTSYQVGYGVDENAVLDTAVVTLKDNALVATGIGTAKVRIDGVLYEVTVTAAPISLLLLIGQSNMRGSEGNADQSIVCPDGMVYATFGDDRGDAEGIMNAKNATNFAASALTGEYSTINVNGTTDNLSYYPINSLTEAGKGTFGPDSGFAYEWVKQTGEKVWVVNAAHGGSSITSWAVGATNFKEADLLFSACQETLRKEIAAGHFTLSHMGYFWCQGCSDYDWTAEEYVTKYLAMHDGLKEELTFDHDSDETTADKALEFAGIIPVRAGHDYNDGYREGVYTDSTTQKFYESFLDLQMTGPRVAQYWMCNNPELEDIWMVCNVGEDWVWMPDGTNGVTDYFQAHYENGTVDYTTQVQQKAAWYTPTTPKEVHDSIHYNQIGYNEVGRESARNALIMLGEIQAPDVETTVEFVSWDGYSEVTTVDAYTEGKSDTLVVPKVYPIWKSKDVTYTLSDGLTWDYYDLLVENDGIGGTLSANGMTDRVSVTGHTWSDWETKSEASAVGPGVQQRVCSHCGKTDSRTVDGVWQIYDLAEHLQELPEGICGETNLWTMLPHEDVHFTSGKKWGKTSTATTSITIPVNPGDKIYATSWNKAGENGHATSDGIRLTFFDDKGIAQTLGPGESYRLFAANGGYLVAPEGSIALNVVMWYDSDEYEVYILNREHCYENGICTGCGEADPNEVAEPLDLRYDDHYDVTGKAVEIIDVGKPTSYQVGYGVEENKVLDTAVVTLEGNYLVATGIGTAKVRIDGVLYEVTVTAAPISLLLVIGQSNAEGMVGNANQSVACENGQVYSTYAKANGLTGDAGLTVENASNYVPSALTGPHSTVNVNGTDTKLSGHPVNSLTEEGSGKYGMDSGLAYEWTKQTGEKVWVVNAAHGASSISSWQPGQSDYEEAKALLGACQEVLMKEIAAGHYTFSRMGYYWCQGCADETKSAEWYVGQYLAMHEGLKTEFSFDGDLNVNTPDDTMEFGNIVLVMAGHENAAGYRTGTYTDSSDNFFASFKELEMRGPRVAQIWMANNPELEDIHIVCTLAQDWVTMPDGSDGVAEYFATHYENGVIDYPTQVKQSTSWYKPTTPAAVKNSIHYYQVGYNEVGRESVRNTLYILGLAEKPDVETTVTFVDWTGYQIADTVKTSTVASTNTLVVPMVYPCYESKNVTYSVSDNLIYSYYDLLDSGVDGGTLTASIGSQSVQVIGRDYYAYRFELDNGKMVSVSDSTFRENALTQYAGQKVFTTAEPIILKHDKPWRVEFNSVATDRFMALATTPSSTEGMFYFFKSASNSGVLSMGEYKDGKYQNYGLLQHKVDIDWNQPHVYRFQNVINEDGTNTVHIYIDDVWTCTATELIIDGASKGTGNMYLSGKDFAFTSVGCGGFGLSTGQMTYLEVWEDYHAHTYENGICTGCGAKEPVSHIPGDITGDGKVNNKDVTRLFKYLSGYDVEVDEAALDINGDGKINNKDLTRLFRYLSGHDVTIY